MPKFSVSMKKIDSLGRRPYAARISYSLTGRFDASEMPDNMRAWLQGYAEQIRQLGDVSAAPAAAADPSLTAIGLPLCQVARPQHQARHYRHFQGRYGHQHHRRHRCQCTFLRPARWVG